jgi:DNA invertase Pin-like site-specific DNA recombinase
MNQELSSPEPMTVSYNRVSTDSQDLEKSRILINEYVVKNKFIVNETIEVQISTRKTQDERRVNELLALPPGSKILCLELSRLGRNMFETLNLINDLFQKGVEIIFIRQPELSTTGQLRNLIIAIYSYIAEAERDYISLRTKQGLHAAKEKGVKLGRRKGSRNKNRTLDPFKVQITELLRLCVPIGSILKIINGQLSTPVTYSCLWYFVRTELSDT